MADFNPPDSHWAADFDGRLASTFHHLKDELESLNARLAEFEAKDAARDAELAQAIADMKFYATRGTT